MFIPLLEALRDAYPMVRFDLYIECGQEEIFHSVPDKDAQGYDHVFSLNFPMAEGSNLTKVEKCAAEEIGLDISQRPLSFQDILRDYDSPLVLCHFHGTALPQSVGCPEPVAHQIWNEIIEAGKVPMECHFQHVFHNPVNEKFQWVDSTVRACQPKLSSLIGLIQHSFAFVGVASGPLITALSHYPERVFFLEKHHRIESYVKFPVTKMHVDNYQPGAVRNWILNL